jgi:hypothetical protein
MFLPVNSSTSVPDALRLSLHPLITGLTCGVGSGAGVVDEEHVNVT